MLTIEQLWDLPIEELDALAVSLEKESEQEAGRKTFLRKRTSENRTAKLKFDIVIDVLNTRVEENEQARMMAEKRAKKQDILRILADKKNKELSEKSIEELEKALEELDGQS